MMSQGPGDEQGSQPHLILEGTGILERGLWEGGGVSESPVATPGCSPKGACRTAQDIREPYSHPKPLPKAWSDSAGHSTPFLTSRHAHGHSAYPAPQDILEEHHPTSNLSFSAFASGSFLFYQTREVTWAS